MVKAFEADGMPLWGIAEYAMPMVSGTTMYAIGDGLAVDIPKPLKIIQAWNRDVTSKVDILCVFLLSRNTICLAIRPLRAIQFNYTISPCISGELKLFPTPDATAAANNQIYFVYQRPFERFPCYWR